MIGRTQEPIAAKHPRTMGLPALLLPSSDLSVAAVATAALGLLALVLLLIRTCSRSAPASPASTKARATPATAAQPKAGAGGAGAGRAEPEQPKLTRAQLKALAAKQARMTKGKGVVPRHPSLVRALKGHQGTVTSTAFSPDGRYVATAGDDGLLVIWVRKSFTKPEPRALKVKMEYDHATALAFSEDGKVLAAATADSREIVFYVVSHKSRPKEKRRFTTAHDAPIVDLFLPTFRLLPDSLFVVTRGSARDESIRVYNINGNLLQTVKPQQGTLSSVSINRDSTLMAVTGVGACEAKVWSIDRAGREFKCMTKALVLAHKAENQATAVSLSRAGNKAVVCTASGAWQVWGTDVEYARFGEDARFESEHEATTIKWQRVAVAPDASMVCLASSNKLMFADITTGKQLGDVIDTSPANTITQVSFSPSGNCVCTRHQRQKYALLWACPAK